MSETVSGTRRKLKTSATWKILGGPDHHHPMGIQSAPPGVRGVVRDSLGGLLHRRSEHGRETSSFVLPIRLVLSRAASVIEVNSLYAPETWTSSDFNPGTIQRRTPVPWAGRHSVRQRHFYRSHLSKPGLADPLISNLRDLFRRPSAMRTPGGCPTRCTRVAINKIISLLCVIIRWSLRRTRNSLCLLISRRVWFLTTKLQLIMAPGTPPLAFGDVGNPSCWEHA